MKFEHILFPVDFSARSRAVNKQVEWLADRFNAHVTLLHVFEIPASWYPAGEATFFNMECLEELKQIDAQRLKDYALEIPANRLQRVQVEGSAAEEIANWANAHCVDLVVLATQGHGAIGGFLLGSVATRVLHSTPCPVWTDSRMLESSNNLGVSKILCAVEMTGETVPLLRFTHKLAQDLNADVQLIHAVPEAATLPYRYFDFDLHSQLIERATLEIGNLQLAAGTSFPLEVSGLNISEAVEKAATGDRADLLVIGRGRAQKPFARFQSHAYDIIKHSPCPVLSYAVGPQQTTSDAEFADTVAVL